MKGLRAKLTFAFGCILAGSMANAATLLVPSQYPTIADAVAAATDGVDEIHVTEAGTYASFDLDKAVPVIGTVADVIVSGPTEVSAAGGPSRLENLTFTHSGNSISIENGNVDLTIEGCTITGDKTNNGLRVRQPATITIQNSTFTGNQWGIRTVANAAGCTIIVEDTVFDDNDNFAIHLQRDANLTLTNVTLNNTPNNDGLRVGAGTTGASTIVATNSSFNGNDTGVTFLEGGTLTATNCTFSNNQVRGFYVNNIPDAHSVTITLNDCTVSDNVGREGIFVVNSPLADVQVNLQNGTVVSGNGLGDTQAGLRSNSPAAWTIENSVISGNGKDGLQIDGLGAGSSLTATDSVFSNNGDRGLLIARMADTTLTRVEILDNGRWGFQRAFGLESAGTGLTTHHFEEVTISGNGDVGLLVDLPGDYVSAEVTIEDSDISGGTAPVVSLGSYPLEGDPGAVSATIDRTFIRNVAAEIPQAEVLRIGNSDTVVRNTVIEGAAAGVTLQAPVSTEATGSSLLHCTIVGSADSPTTAGVVLSSGTGHQIINSIVSGYDVGLLGDGADDFDANRHNLINSGAAYGGAVTDPGSAANNIVGLDPVFVTAYTGPGTGNYHLQSSSPALNAGDGTLGITEDITGAVRPAADSAGVDIGAYEESVAASAQDWISY